MFKGLLNVTVLAAAVLFVSNTSFASQRVKECSSQAQYTVDEALDFIQTNIYWMLDATTVGIGDRNNIQRHVENRDIKCKDHTNWCDVSGRVVDDNRSGNVKLCYNRIRAQHGNGAFCELVRWTALGLVRKSRIWNQGSKLTIMMNKAHELCVAGSENRSIPRNTNN